MRVDSHVQSFDQIPDCYDSLLAKLVVWGRTESEAISRMLQALKEMSLEGVATTQPFFSQLLVHPKFLEGNYSTAFVEEHMQELTQGTGDQGLEAAVLSMVYSAKKGAP